MKRLLLLEAATAVAAAALAGSAMADGVGPPGGTFYAFDRAFQSVITPTSIPDKGPFDTLYMFPDCANCAPVSDAAPGHSGYNGGRWRVVQAFGITSQLTNAQDVVAQATSFNDTGVRFVCPLIP
jgi:hypothetical protein